MGLRVVPALVMGAVIVLTGLVARELGGSRFAQGFAAACVATSGLVVVGHLEGPTVFDVCTWALTTWLVVRILRTGDERLWLAVGVAVGVGLEAKQTVLLLLGGLAVGFVVNRQRKLFRERVALGRRRARGGRMGAQPRVASRERLAHAHDERQPAGRALGSRVHAEVSADRAARDGHRARPGLVGRSLGALGRAAVPSLPGIHGAAFGFAIAFVWIVIPDRFYYVFGIYPVLFATTGAIVTDRVVAGTRGFFRAAPKHRWLWRSRRVAIGIVAVNFLLFVPLALPVLPESAVAAANLNKVNYNLGEEIGWPEFTRQVARAWRALPASERARSVLFTSNYGEAGALMRYGGEHGLPPAYSGHNSFWWWGPPPDSATAVVAVGARKQPGFVLLPLPARGQHPQPRRRRQRRARRPRVDLHPQEHHVEANLADAPALRLTDQQTNREGR